MFLYKVSRYVGFSVVVKSTDLTVLCVQNRFFSFCCLTRLAPRCIVENLHRTKAVNTAILPSIMFDYWSFSIVCSKWRRRCAIFKCNYRIFFGTFSSEAQRLSSFSWFWWYAPLGSKMCGEKNRVHCEYRKFVTFFFIKYFHKTHDIGICRVHRNKTTTELLLQREIRHPSNGGCKKRRRKKL